VDFPKVATETHSVKDYLGLLCQRHH